MKTTTPVILILVAIGLFYTFINPKYQEVQVLSAEADEYREVLKSVSEIRSTMDDLTEKYEQFPPSEVERLNKAVPDNVDAVRLALDLDGMAGVHGISIKNIKVETGAVEEDGSIYVGSNSPTHSEATVTFTFVSNYENFRKFLADIEDSLRIIDIESIVFQSTDSGLYDHKISVVTYWIP